MSKNIELVFNISKSVDMFIAQNGLDANIYMDDMPLTVRSSASAILEIKTYIATTILHSLAHGEAELSIESTISSVFEHLTSSASNEVIVNSAILRTEMLAMVEDISSVIEIDSAVTGTLVAVMAGTISPTVDIETSIAHTALGSSSKADGDIYINSSVESNRTSSFSGVDPAELHIDATIYPHVKSDAKDLVSKIEISSSVSSTRVVIFRTVADCDLLTVADLEPMTVEQFYLTEI